MMYDTKKGVQTCTICSQKVAWNFFHWVSIEHPVFPQYCPDAFQNSNGSQKHVVAMQEAA